MMALATVDAPGNFGASLLVDKVTADVTVCADDRTIVRVRIKDSVSACVG